MTVSFYKYQGAGNDFILIDNRTSSFQLSTIQIHKLCDRHFGIGADGLILLEHSNIADFKMVYFNSDGKLSTMCGNGGRCIVAFAKQLNIIDNHTQFEAIDGLHEAEIISDKEPCIVRLKMQDVSHIHSIDTDAYILDTGSPHYVKIVKNIDSIHVYEEGRKIRYSDSYQEKGINVNFVQIESPEHILVRTYERGVENETLACGTGVTASAIVTAWRFNLSKASIHVKARGGNLSVDLQKSPNSTTYQHIYLTGNATFVFKGEIDI